MIIIGDIFYMMNRFNTVLACLILSVTIAVPLVVSGLASRQVISANYKQFDLHLITSDVSVIAHRGASAYGPEHTIPAYQQAIKMKADYVEMDLQMTKDGQLIVMHDETLDRTTNVREVYPERTPWRVKDFTLEEIRKLDAGSWFNKKYPNLAQGEYIGLNVPTLDEAIKLIKREGKGSLYIETKAPNIYPGMEEQLINSLKENNFINERDLIIESFSEESLRKLKSMVPNLKLIQLYTASMLKNKDLYHEFKRISDYAYGVGPNKELVKSKLVEAADLNKLVVHPWTVNSEEDLAFLLSLGVDGVFTNTPDKAVCFLN
jgi:glycerophosphoryl diester phosphodiesterase